MATEYKSFYPKTRKAWRDWLANHHDKSVGVWFVSYKKETGKPSVSYAEAVEEALCFGWIDSVKKKIDDEKSQLKFSPRKPTSGWSDLNKSRIKKLIRDNLMTAAGMTRINEAKKNGTWHKLTATNRHIENNTLPEELSRAFAKNKKALTNFISFAPSYRKQFLTWIDAAKLPATRAARIKQTVLMARLNKKPGANGFNI